jgi:hypothetical protein
MDAAETKVEAMEVQASPTDRTGHALRRPAQTRLTAVAQCRPVILDALTAKSNGKLRMCLLANGAH